MHETNLIYQQPPRTHRATHKTFQQPKKIEAAIILCTLCVGNTPGQTVIGPPVNHQC